MAISTIAGLTKIWAQGARAGDPLIFLSVEQNNKVASVSQSVSYFTVPPRAHPSTGSQSGSATPGLTQVPSSAAASCTTAPRRLPLHRRP